MFVEFNFNTHTHTKTHNFFVVTQENPSVYHGRKTQWDSIDVFRFHCSLNHFPCVPKISYLMEITYIAHLRMIE